MASTQASKMQCEKDIGSCVMASPILSTNKEIEIKCSQAIELVIIERDAAQSENVRLKLKVEQLGFELNHTKEKLREAQNAQYKTSSCGQHDVYTMETDAMDLLAENGILLKIWKDRLLETLDELDEKIEVLEIDIEPLNETHKYMSCQLNNFCAEKAALQQEVKFWQARAHNLLQESHGISLKEYKNIVSELEELKIEKQSFAEKLRRKDAEIHQLQNDLMSIRKDLNSIRKSVDEKSDDIIEYGADDVKSGYQMEIEKDCYFLSREESGDIPSKGDSISLTAPSDDFSDMINYVGIFYEYGQKHHLDTCIQIALVKGPMHSPRFKAVAFLDKKEISSAWGKSKFQARKIAASTAVEKLCNHQSKV